MVKQLQLEQLQQQLLTTPDELKLSVIQGFLCGVTNPLERQQLEILYWINKSHPLPNPSQDIVVLIHGIRTNAPWQEKFAAKLEGLPNVKAFPIGYGYFDAPRFWFPFITRRRPIEHVARQIRTLKNDNPNARISVIAHSFGTYIISKILDDQTDISIHRLQLCGSIISPQFRWDKVKPRIKGAVLNDVGTDDVWPALATSVTWDYGSSGALGFKDASVRDRFFKCGHSDFFTDIHMEKYWIPFLLDGQIVPSPWSSVRSQPNKFIEVMSFIPLKSIGAIAIIAFAYLRWSGSPL